MTIIIKPSDESRNTTTTLAADSDLQFTMLPNKTYLIYAAVRHVSGATPDFKWAPHAPAPAVVFGAAGTNWVSADSYAESALTVSNSECGAISPANVASGTSRSVAGSDSAATNNSFQIMMAVTTGATGGQFAIHWAQATSSATNATVKAGSVLEYIEVDPAEIVVKQVDEARATAAIAKDGELFMDLEADTCYLVSMGVLAQVGDTFTRRVNVGLNFSGTFDSLSTLCRELTSITATNSWSTNLTAEAIAAGVMPSAVTAMSAVGATASFRGSIVFDGLLKTTSAGELSVNWYKSDNGGSPSTLGTVFAGSYLIARKVAVDLPIGA